MSDGLESVQSDARQSSKTDSRRSSTKFATEEPTSAKSENVISKLETIQDSLSPGPEGKEILQVGHA